MVENISGNDYLCGHYQWSFRTCSPPIHPSRKHTKCLFSCPNVVCHVRYVLGFRDLQY